MRALLFSILLFILLLFISKKETFVENNKNEKLDEIIKYLNSAINNRVNAGAKSKFRSQKYKNQILPLKNAMNYASYIQKNII